MKNLFKKAHELTRRMVEKYKDIDYKAQFSINLSYLQEEIEVEIAQLKGSVKQVAWGEDVRKEMIEDFKKSFDYFKETGRKKALARTEKAFIKIMKIADARFFIENRYKGSASLSRLDREGELEIWFD